MAKRRAGRTKRRTPKKMSKRMSKAMRRGKRTKKRSSKRKGKKPASNWNKHMMMVYKSMKAKDPSVKLGDAMKAAKKTYNKGRPLSMSVDGGGPAADGKELPVYMVTRQSGSQRQPPQAPAPRPAQAPPPPGDNPAFKQLNPFNKKGGSGCGTRRRLRR